MVDLSGPRSRSGGVGRQTQRLAHLSPMNRIPRPFAHPRAHRLSLVLAITFCLALASAAWGWLVAPALADVKAKSGATKLQFGCRNKLSGVIRPLGTATVRCR